MKYLLSIEDVIAIHDAVINPNEMQGLAADKSLDSALSRIDNRLQYGLIHDVYDLAASYAVCIAVGHTFHDANKRTAFQSMDLILDLHGIEITYPTHETGDMIIRAATGAVDETELAHWLRRQSPD